jgi:hypothetical protein
VKAHAYALPPIETLKKDGAGEVTTDDLTKDLTDDEAEAEAAGYRKAENCP